MAQTFTPHHAVAGLKARLYEVEMRTTSLFKQSFWVKVQRREVGLQKQNTLLVVDVTVFIKVYVNEEKAYDGAVTVEHFYCSVSIFLKKNTPLLMSLRSSRRYKRRLMCSVYE